jgi:hypothetical protein
MPDWAADEVSDPALNRPRCDCQYRSYRSRHNASSLQISNSDSELLILDVLRASGHASWQPEKRVNDRAGSLAGELGYLNALGIRRDFEEERTEAVREIMFRVLSRRH